ncbi:hypothetical protein PV797_04930 [Clostridiaceae bacterium M8S5]|nr:hypothetical protein PV797_04930 [Clostridiaceae bacterium M8S5]
MGLGSQIQSRDIKFKNINYLNKECIKGLIRFYYGLETSTIYNTNFELVSILIDIKDSIENSELTSKQKLIIKLYQEGFTEKQIGKKLNITQQGIHKCINSVCCKISMYLNNN